MRVHALTLDRGGCFYYRVRGPLTAMQRRGHWTSWGSGVDFETWDRAGVLINQYLHLPQTRQDWIRWADGGEKLCVWEADDDITTVLQNEAAGSAYRNPETVPRMLDMLRASHLATVTTSALADVYRPFNPNVVVLPNRVPSWLTTQPRRDPQDQPAGMFTIGYTGSASHARDFEAWSPIFARWMRWHPRTRLHLIGHNGRPAGMPTTYPCTSVPWIKDTNDYLAALPGAMSVGIAPLLHNDFNLGKSGVKAMEYAAAGIPCVATDHPIYRDVIVDGVTGYLVRTPNEWIDALTDLSGHRTLREQMGRSAREHAIRHFTQEASVAGWEDAYEQASSRIGVKL